MPSEFRFLLFCLEPVKSNGVVSLNGVVNTLHVSESDFPTDLVLYAVIGAILRESMWGKPLDLMAWQLGNKAEREKLVKFVGAPLILPEEKGAVVLPYRVSVPIWTPGFYGFDLFDREGIFGPPEHLLATYLYAIDAV